jgi:outer membrane autotransporter protein
MDFSGNLLSCRVNGTDTASINREGQCLWMGFKARFLDADRTFENIGYDETAGLFAAGAQLALGPVWRLGFGVGYQTSSLDTDTGAESNGDQVQGGIALKYNPGALLLAGVVSGGRGWYDTTRPMDFGSFAATAEGDHQIDVLAGRLHASYVFGSPSLYVKPLIDAGATRLDLDDVTETGAGGASLVVHGDANTVYSVSPALELGTEWWLSNGTLVRPFVRAGVTWFSDDDVALSSSFAGTPAGVAPFTILAEMDQVQADVSAGLEMITSEDSALRIYYGGHFGDTVEIHSVGLKGSAKF